MLAVVEARSAVNKAREDIAQMLQEQELEAEKIRWDIEARRMCDAQCRRKRSQGADAPGPFLPLTTAPCGNTNWRDGVSKWPRSWCCTPEVFPGGTQV